MGPSSPASPPGPAAARRRMHPDRRRLMFAAGMALFGAFLPWVLTSLGNISGARGAGLWVAYAAMLGLAGALVPMRRVAAVQGAILAAVAIGLPLWQIVHLLGLVGTGGWLPGPGLVLCLGAGVLAAVASRGILRSPA